MRSGLLLQSSEPFHTAKQLKWHCLLFAVQHAWPGLCGWVQVEELAGEYSRGIRLNETFAMLAGGNIRTESLLIQLKQKVMRGQAHM